MAELSRIAPVHVRAEGRAQTTPHTTPHSPPPHTTPHALPLTTRARAASCPPSSSCARRCSQAPGSRRMRCSSRSACTPRCIGAQRERRGRRVWRASQARQARPSHHYHHSPPQVVHDGSPRWMSARRTCQMVGTGGTFRFCPSGFAFRPCQTASTSGAQNISISRDQIYGQNVQYPPKARPVRGALRRSKEKKFVTCQRTSTSGAQLEPSGDSRSARVKG